MKSKYFNLMKNNRNLRIAKCITGNQESRENKDIKIFNQNIYFYITYVLNLFSSNLF